MTQTTRRAALLVLAAVSLAVPAAGAWAAPSVSPRDASAETQKGTELAEEFLNLLQDEDEKGLAKFLSPAFQIQRADGSYLNREEYLEAPAKVEFYEIEDLRATKTGNVYVVRYDLIADVTIDGVQQSTAPAPRLSVFVKGKGGWQIAAHANFNVPEAEATTTTTTEPDEG
jgi:hypothetical protein